MAKSHLRQVLSIVIAAVVMLQPAVACCGALMAADGTATPAQEATTTAERGHCGEPPAPAIDEHRCECGDGCASLEALSPKAPEAALLPAADDPEPVALACRLPATPPASRPVLVQGLPPPEAAPPPRPTLVSLKRLLLI